MSKIKIIDLFSGTGGLLEGFMQTKKYEPVASVEWEKAPIENLVNRLEKKWGIKDAKESSIWFDMQRSEELFKGFTDEKFGTSKGLDYYARNGVDVIIGGPPCQAYSVAGRIQDKEGMKKDYRNYLFEYYLKVVDRYKPQIFVFENVPGMLSAMPDGTLITDLIKSDIEKIGYEVIEDFKKYALIDTSEYGVPQNRKRVILLGIRKDSVNGSSSSIQDLLKNFYKELLPKRKEPKKISVREAIGDLPKLYPMEEKDLNKGTRKISHTMQNNTLFMNHEPRFHNMRDISIFGMLAEDLASGRNEYKTSDKKNEIYNQATGGNSKVHKYHVLKEDSPSTTILAHLYKDGLRFIHYDPKQKRSITVREAARLQSFPDDFEFISGMGNNYKMIGNAVPPEFSRRLSLSIIELLESL